MHELKHQVLLPQLVDTQYSFVLKIVLTVLSHFKSLVPMIMQFNLLKAIQGCIDNGEYELAQQAIYAIPFPADTLHQNKAMADHLMDKLGQAKTTNEASYLCAILTQWALREMLKITPDAARTVATVIKNGDVVEMTRVMPCVAYIASKDHDGAKLMATSENFVGASKLFSPKMPQEYITPAICFGQYISKYLIITDATEMPIKVALEREIALAKEAKVDVLVLSYILQTFANLPEGEKTTSMIAQLNMNDLITVATTNPIYTSSDSVKKLVEKLRRANRA